MDFANFMGFDPLVSENWYRVSANQIKTKGANRLLEYYRGSHKAAIADAFPELDFSVEWLPSS